MAKKTVGYVQLEWACPRCATRNPGPQKFCNGCGGPQPADVQFTQAAQEKILTDTAEIARAKAGPDIHCPYCGARNSGTAKFCGACGGKMEGGQVRQAGQVVGDHRAGPAAPVKCRSCGTENPAGASRCGNCGASLVDETPRPAAPAIAPRPSARRGLVAGGAAVLLLGCCAVAAIVFLFVNRTQKLTGVVEEIHWSRTLTVETLLAVAREDWQDNIPGDAQIGPCLYEYRWTQAEPAPLATEVCGTPYTVDTGGGYGEVVQDCSYDVYDEWCAYTAEEWQEVDTLTAAGSDLGPYWPAANLAGGERPGSLEEHYNVVFRTNDGLMEYQPADETEYAQFSIGSSWALEVNALGEITVVSSVP